MTRVGDYELLETLASSNHGVFYKAIPPGRLGIGDEFVALKVMEQHSTDNEFRRVANQLRVFASVDSERVVRLLDAGQQHGRLFYAMRWHPDGSLASPACVVSRAGCVRIVADAARGAHALHEVGVVHRDIKPANILIDGQQGLLSDFGLAQLMTPAMTTTGVGSVDSIEFMEPDVIWGEKAARSSDIWSLALTLHQGVCGQGAFGEIPESNVFDAFKHVLHQRPTLSEVLGERLRPVVEKALSEHRSDRYRTALEFAEELDNLEGLD